MAVTPVDTHLVATALLALREYRVVNREGSAEHDPLGCIDDHTALNSGVAR
jgi:hypothetical protein